ncbi:hypothetical protein [Nostoc sp. CHAB 5715]|nr:hypothetical protein [Nostoc sp. CHAB 5715]
MKNKSKTPIIANLVSRHLLDNFGDVVIKLITEIQLALGIMLIM